YDLKEFQNRTQPDQGLVLLLDGKQTCGMFPKQKSGAYLNTTEQMTFGQSPLLVGPSKCAQWDYQGLGYDTVDDKQQLVAGGIYTICNCVPDATNDCSEVTDFKKERG
ncbi:unnamed protein product, partial [Amoebophrya sp. A120]